MNKYTVIMLFLILTGCGPDYSHTKFYDYLVVNQLDTQIVKIVPLSTADFWITPADTFIVRPGDSIFIGTKTLYDDNEKIVDIYEPDDTIEKFELFVDNNKQEKDFTQRKSWVFINGPVDESGFYKLFINNITLNSK
jgi:hypothetical protein